MSSEINKKLEAFLVSRGEATPTFRETMTREIAEARKRKAQRLKGVRESNDMDELAEKIERESRDE